MAEFNKKYFPKGSTDVRATTDADLRAMARNLAKRSLGQFRRRLAE